MEISGKGVTTSLTLRTKRTNNKQRASINITGSTNHDLGELIKEFNNSHYLCNKNKKVHNELTKDFLFIIKYFSKLTKIKKNIGMHTKRVKLDVDRTKLVNETIGNVNEIIHPVINSMNCN